MKWSIVFCIFFSLLFNQQDKALYGQNVILGKEINFNSDDGFFLIGMVKDSILLFQENRNEYFVQVYKRNLDHLFTKELLFEKQKIHFNSIVGRDNDFSIIYSFEERFRLKTIARKYDTRGNMLDSILLFEEREYLDADHFSHVLSDDKNKLLLFRTFNFNRIEFILFDLESFTKTWTKEIKFEDFNVPGDLNGLLLTNDGRIILAFEKDNFTYRRKKHKQSIFSINPQNDQINNWVIDFKGYLSSSFNFVSDEKNKELVISGFYSTRSSSRAYGFYQYKLDRNGLLNDIEFTPFSADILLEYSSDSRKVKKYIPDLELKDIVLRNDGGMVLISEMQKEIMRESVRRRYVDYHYEDMVLLSVHPDGELFWDELIRKYQLSYDDKARYSSYFLFQNPSQMRIVYNDEIKNENTISEYIFNPLGTGNRSSLFSTDLHRLKLVFEDAVQISPVEFVVPSMNNSQYRIIKIQY